MRKPVWLDRVMIDAIHYDQLQQHGGLRGIKDENAREFALARPRNRLAYKPESTVFDLAAAYGVALATSHPYHDGNKRVAFMTMYVFLGLNGYDLAATEPEVVKWMRALAAGSKKERALATWLRKRSLGRNA